MTPPITIIGITGAAGAGKDTVAERLIAAWTACGLCAIRMSFADPIRSMLSAMGVPAAYMKERDLKEQSVPGFGRSYRHLAQTLGTEWGRTFVHPDIWLQLTARRITETADFIAPTPFVAVISDVRFPNEARWLRECNGLLLRVTRPGVSPVADHASEHYFTNMPADVEIQNIGPLDTLELNCDGLAPMLIGMARRRAERTQTGATA